MYSAGVDVEGTRTGLKENPNELYNAVDAAWGAENAPCYLCMCTYFVVGTRIAQAMSTGTCRKLGKCDMAVGKQQEEDGST